jgi:hypothetical protein
MASLKSKAKTTSRPSLYYGKYEYKVVVKSPHMYYTWGCKTIDDYRNRIITVCEEYDSSRMYRWRPRPDVEDWEYDLIEKLLNLATKYKEKVEYTTRRENKSFGIYTSNVKIVKEVLSFKPDAEITQISLMPQGVLTFKREPPAKYRAYTTNNKMPIDFKEEMKKYLARTPDVKPSNAFYEFLHRTTKFSYSPWLWSSYYLDYNDDKNLMMMTLMFPGMIGKNYKLEKK